MSHRFTECPWTRDEQLFALRLVHNINWTVDQLEGKIDPTDLKLIHEFLKTAYVMTELDLMFQQTSEGQQTH